MSKVHKPENAGFRSEIDSFLQDLERKLQKQSPSEQAEVKKHARIAKLRDNVQERSESSDFWEEF